MKWKQLAESLAVNRSSIYRQLNGGGISYRTAQKYSERLGLQWHEIMAMAAAGTLTDLLRSVKNGDVHNTIADPNDTQ